jgi:hypothetical protein
MQCICRVNELFKIKNRFGLHFLFYFISMLVKHFKVCVVYRFLCLPRKLADYGWH